MIVGDTVLSQRFRQLSCGRDEGLCIYAKHGHLTSDEPSEFQLECQNLLTLKPNGKVIYFSTIQVENDQRQDNGYIRQLRKIEDFIQRNLRSYLIIRVPILIGDYRDNSLIEFFKERIDRGETFTVYSTTCRYFIELDDLIENTFKSSHLENEIINMALYPALNILKVVSILERFLDKKASFNIINKGDCIDLKTEFSVKSEEYLLASLQKHYSQNI